MMRRAIAAIGDSAIGILCGAIPGYAVVVLSFDIYTFVIRGWENVTDHYTPTEVQTWLLSVTGTVIFLTTWLYFALYESDSEQATPCKAALGLVVIGQHGTRIRRIRAITRSLLGIIATVTIVGVLVDLLSDGQLALQNRLTGTTVIQRARTGVD